jgi:hypothetical protein
VRGDASHPAPTLQRPFFRFSIERPRWMVNTRHC